MLEPADLCARGKPRSVVHSAQSPSAVSFARETASNKSDAGLPGALIDFVLSQDGGLDYCAGFSKRKKDCFESGSYAVLGSGVALEV